ncbi:flagellar biosynthesis protein FlhF [Paraliobacillus quinghaiensis]|uniref:Flagellar biosynthesis protein FlhF n=1 Tax=Paraliobacillus quinghaiensis TaxID=470815 RepID=A0A917WPP3_9BACI|nr:flagellar biosynthesis protein FlhF [Paraliobacillus quinghaiensis]GGM21491.1 flagellar biosynthesis protein FlhF [Paraliobacillus quinghaiensis]
MKVKKFMAPTMPEVMKKVRKDLGNDAVILNSKVVYTGGFLGLFKKRNTEVIAALDPQPSKPKVEEPKKTINTAKPANTTFSVEDNKQQVLLDEVRALRKWMEKTNNNDNFSFPATYQAIFDLLLEQEVDTEIAKELVTNVIQDGTTEDITYQHAQQQIKNEIINKLNDFDFGGITYQKKFVHLVGPTGVGKTTTIAKIAANCMLNDGKKVALITTDTYRIAAIEQLKTYSKILDIPLEIAYTMDDYRQAREKFQSYDIVLVDTAGRNFRDPKYIQALGKVVDLQHDIDTYLVLSLTTKSTDLEVIYQQFENIPIKKLIFTKKDETATYGPIVNLALKNKIGVAYLTNGQDVPDNIEEATTQEISRLLIGELSNV